MAVLPGAKKKMRWQSWREQIHAVGSVVGFEFCKTVAGSGKTNKHRVTILLSLMNMSDLDMKHQCTSDPYSVVESSQNHAQIS